MTWSYSACASLMAGFEVEFVTAEGTTVAVLTLEPTDIRPVGGREILHVRELVPASAA